jgi:chaperone required for assembly of F1-ATPase
MRSFLNRYHTAAVFHLLLSSSSRTCASTPADLTIAPKKTKQRLQPQLDTSSLLQSIPKDPAQLAHAELSTAELEKKVDEWSKLSQSELDELQKKFEAEEEAGTQVLQDDSLYQLDVSTKNRSAGATKVFWSKIDVTPLSDSGKHAGWFAVTVDGRKVKAFESSAILAIPNEALALACAKEWAEQEGYLNKLLMPLTDLCSGAMHVAPQHVRSRIDYLMSFYQNDNCYFRSAAIQDRQDKMIEPLSRHFERLFDVEVPRIVGIGHPQVPPHYVNRVRDGLVAMNLNQYQVVALCVVAQFTSSLLLPLALFHRVVDLPTALSINRAEEGHNIDTEGLVKGYHDIREADVAVKICASAAAWQLTQGISLAKCSEIHGSVTSHLQDLEMP